MYTNMRHIYQRLLQIFHQMSFYNEFSEKNMERERERESEWVSERICTSKKGVWDMLLETAFLFL